MITLTVRIQHKARTGAVAVVPQQNIWGSLRGGRIGMRVTESLLRSVLNCCKSHVTQRP